MAAKASASCRVVKDAEVRQAPRPSSDFFYIAQAGNIVHLLGPPANVAGHGWRIPIKPRGWIDAAALEPLDEEARRLFAKIAEIPAGASGDKVATEEPQLAAEHQRIAAAPRPDAERREGRGGGWQQTWGDSSSRHSSRQDDQPPLFAGTLLGEPGAAGEVLVECQQALALFGDATFRVASRLLPPELQQNAVLCVELVSAEAQVREVALVVTAADAVKSGRALVGSIKAVTRRSSGEEVGWIACSATTSHYLSDVYVHQSMLTGIRLNDVVSFRVYENSKGQPQASNGSVRRLTSALASPPREVAPTRSGLLAGIDATALPGRSSRSSS